MVRGFLIRTAVRIVIRGKLLMVRGGGGGGGGSVFAQQL